MAQDRVVVVLEPGYADYETERRILAPFGVGVTAVGAKEDAVKALERLNPEAILVRERRVDAACFDAAPNLKAVVRYGVGVDNVDLSAARDRGVAVANVPDYGAAEEVSDQAVALYLAVARRVVTRDAQVRAGGWDFGQREPIHGHRGGTLGLIGFGRIARRAREKFGALGFSRVLVVDPALTEEQADAARVECADVDRICGDADLVSLHAPASPETAKMIDARRIRLMKPTAIIVNVARGELIDEAALAAALREGRIFGAGLDVFAEEPPAPDNPLLALPNTVLSDHNGWYSEFSVRELQSKAAGEVARVLGGAAPEHWVNPW
jgi:D-3-phosphoglycerate dehydrogenase